MATLFIQSQTLNRSGLNVALGNEKIISILDGTLIALTNKGTLIDLTTMECSSELKKVMIYEIKLVTIAKLQDATTILVFVLEHDMIMAARTSQISLSMPDILFSAGQSKIKGIRELKVNQDRFLILASESIVEVRRRLLNHDLDSRVRAFLVSENGY